MCSYCRPSASSTKEEELPEESRVYRFRSGQQHYVVLLEGTYKVKVKVKAAGNANYKASAARNRVFC